MRSERGVVLVVSCEHGGCDVPAEYRHLFDGAGELLRSHRGFDRGAADVARAFAERLNPQLFVATTTRLLIDLNRSPHHPRLFSERTRALPLEERARLIDAHYRPYRDGIEAWIARATASQAFVLHVSSHSFTPVLDGAVRRADVAFLYDPRRPAEASFATAWRDVVREAAPDWIVRRNYPYRGVADGLTTHLRKRFGADVYAGIELEVNQRLVDGPAWQEHVTTLAESLERAIARARLARSYTIAEDATESSPPSSTSVSLQKADE